MLLVDPSTRLTMADVQASRWFHTLAPGLRDDPAPPRTPAADARSFGKSFGGPLRLCLLPCGPSCEDESSLTSPKSVLDLPPSLDMVAGAGAARGADRHLLRSQSEADDEGDGDSPASAATPPPLGFRLSSCHLSHLSHRPHRSGELRRPRLRAGPSSGSGGSAEIGRRW